MQLDSSMAKLLLIFIGIILLVGATRSDLAADERQCKDQLTSLSPCLPFVSGEANSPTAQCCSALNGKINTTLKCICVLIKDRNEPGLGIKINATLALALPSLCHAPSKVSKCVELLGLSPKSKEAQIFLQSGNTTQQNSATAAPVVSSNAASRRWNVSKMCEAMSFWCLVLTLLLSF